MLPHGRLQMLGYLGLFPVLDAIQHVPYNPAVGPQRRPTLLSRIVTATEQPGLALPHVDSVTGRRSILLSLSLPLCETGVILRAPTSSGCRQDETKSRAGRLAGSVFAARKA